MATLTGQICEDSSPWGVEGSHLSHGLPYPFPEDWHSHGIGSPCSQTPFCLHGQKIWLCLTSWRRRQKGKLRLPKSSSDSLTLLHWVRVWDRNRNRPPRLLLCFADHQTTLPLQTMKHWKMGVRQRVNMEANPQKHNFTCTQIMSFSKGKQQNTPCLLLSSQIIS